jgi:WD40 repeat protein
MSAEDDVQELLDRWEDLLHEGQAIAVEDLCRDRPELLEELKHRTRALASMRWLRKLVADLDTPEEPICAEADGQPALGLSHLVAGAEPVPGYRLVQQLGRGGFGAVWKAIGPGGFAVALKAVPLDERAGPVEQRALETIKEVRHPHLLATFGAWESNGTLYMALELAEGTLLDSLGKAQAQGFPGVPLTELLDQMHEAAEGLDFLNAQGILHRDVKPRNLLLVGGSVKVADFGLAKLLADHVAEHSGSLTPAYAAPEFFAGRSAATSDQYSLAVSYCLLRGGRLPFDGNAVELMHGHQSSVPDLSMLPEAERKIVGHALSKEPHHRWPSCRAFVEALRGPSNVSKAATEGYHRGKRLAIIFTGLTLFLALFLILRHQDRLASTGGTLSSPLALQLPPTGRDQSGTARDTPENLSGEVRCLRGHTEGVTWAAFLPDGKRAVSVGSDRVRLWDLDSGKEVGGWPQAEWFHALAPDGRSLLCAGRAEEAWQPVLRKIETGEAICRLPGHQHHVRAMAFLPDGKRVVTGCLDGTLRLWDIEKAVEIRRFQGFDKADTSPARYHRQVWSVAVSLDGKQVLAGIRDTSIRLFDVATGAEIRLLKGHRWFANTLSFAPDGQRALSGTGDVARDVLRPGADQTVRLWDVKKGILVQTFEKQVGGVWCVAITSDGRRALTAGEDRTVLLWDIDSGQTVRRFTGHTATVQHVAFSPDGRRAISASSDQTVRVWNLDREQH